MAGASDKKLLASNQRALTFLRQLMLSSLAFHVIVRHVAFGDRPVAPRWKWHRAAAALAATVAYRTLSKQATPGRNAETGRRELMGDARRGVVNEVCWDATYVTCFCAWTSAMWTDRAWAVAWAVPVVAAYATWRSVGRGLAFVTNGTTGEEEEGMKAKRGKTRKERRKRL